MAGTQKPNRKWRIKMELHELSDMYDDLVIDSEELVRWGVSEKQVVARLRHEFNWYDHDNSTGSIAYEYRFTLTDITEGE